MSAENEMAEEDADFKHLKGHIPDWKLNELKLSESDRHILGTMDLLEQKVNILIRKVTPISRLYEKLSSFWAVLLYVMVGIVGILEAIKILKGLLQ